MSKYTIRVSYLATLDVTVEGDFNDEGEALDKAQDIAEETDIQQFTLGAEKESQILRVE